MATTMKRFYKMVSTSETSCGFEIHLDGRAVNTPSKTVFKVPNQAIADVVVLEWATQGDKIAPDTMPVTQILMTGQDRINTERPIMTPQVLAYLDTDMLCYKIESPYALVDLQDQVWGAFCQNFESRYEAQLLTTTGLNALAQDQDLRARVLDDIEALDDLQFSILQLMTSESGSLILALALLNDPSCAGDVLKAAYLDEDFKDDLYDAKKYGADPITEKSKAAFKADLDACVVILKSL
jgi:chaperone required for assembly of F1-ATPase